MDGRETYLISGLSAQPMRVDDQTLLALGWNGFATRSSDGLIGYCQRGVFREPHDFFWLQLSMMLDGETCGICSLPWRCREDLIQRGATVLSKNPFRYACDRCYRTAHRALAA